jgi:hypothetical protein
MANDVVDPTGEAAAGTMAGEGPGTGGESDFSQYEVGAQEPPPATPSDTTDTTGGINVMSEWVPGEPRTYATQYGPDYRHLVYGVSAAVSPNIAAGHELHEPFEVYDPQGNLVGQYSYDDRSYYSPDNPTYNSIERYGLPSLGRGYSIKWLGQEAGNDFSQYEQENQNDFSQYEVGKDDTPRATSEESDFSKYEVKEEVKPSGGNPFIDFWSNLFGKASETGTSFDVAKAQEDLNRAKSGETKPTLFGVQDEKDAEALKNPNISQADAEEIIERRRQRTEMDRDIAEKQLKRAQEAQATSREMEPGIEYQRSIPGHISSFLGQIAPWMLSGSLGAAAPSVMANQMSEQAYGDTFNRSMEQGRKAHPDWSEEKLRDESDKAARGAAQTGFENGVVMGMLHIPKVGGLVTRMISRLGLRGTYIAIAGASQTIEENIQIKKGVDQNQSIYEGLLQSLESNFATALGFELPGAVGEALGRRRAPAGREVELELPEPTKLPAEQEQRATVRPVPLTAAVKIKATGQVLTGRIHAEAYTNAGLDPGSFKEGEVENGWVDRNGKFISYREGAKQQGITALKPGEKIEEPADPVKAKIDLLGMGDTPQAKAIAARAIRADAGGPEQEAMVVAAVRDKDGNVFSSELGHDSAVKKAGGTRTELESGYLTNKGRFVTDPQDLIRQQEAEQAPVTSPDQWNSTIANRFTQERAARGEFEEVASGEGYATEDLLALGAQMKPEEVAQHVSNLMNNVGGDPVRQAAAVRAREAQLAAESNRLSRTWEDDPNNMEKRAAADQARDALSQFHAGPIAKMKNQWHGIGMSMQGELPFDLGTFNGLRDKWLKEVGKEPSPKVEEKMSKMAKDVRDADAEQRTAQEDLSREIRKDTKRRMSEQDLERYLDEVLKDPPCRID